MAMQVNGSQNNFGSFTSIKVEKENNIKDQKLALKKANFEADLQKKIFGEVSDTLLTKINEITKKVKEDEEDLRDFKEKNEKELEKERKDSLKDISNSLKNTLNSAVNSAVSSLTSTLDSIMTDYVNTQESMAYGLTGLNTDLTTVTTKLSQTLGSTGVVKQSQVYSNLTKLVSSGIVYNAEQRAYLSTIAEDLGMVFNASNGSLTRLINLQREDLSSQRMAIEYSLKEFLNQNYQTSQYIKEGFEDVSSALIDAQSLMSSSAAMQLEATVQEWLGSMSSVGASSSMVNELATAIGQLGSGDLSVLSSSQLPLLAMAANNAGLSLADILNNGLSASGASALLQGITQYSNSLYTGTSSNLVKSELAKAFGISSVSDLKALAQTGAYAATQTLSTDISGLLDNMDNYLYKTTKIENVLANFMYQAAMGVASDSDTYFTYRVTEEISKVVSSLANGVSSASSGIVSTISSVIGGAASAAPLIYAFYNMIKDGGANLSAALTSSSASAIYSALSGNGALSSSNLYLNSTGDLLASTRSSGTNQSSSLVYYNTSTDDVINSARLSSAAIAEKYYEGDEETKDVTDVYNALGEVKDILNGFATTSFGTYTKISETDNTVTIGNDLSFVQDMIAFSALNIQNIYALLVDYLKPTNVSSQSTYDLSQVQWGSPFDWYSSASNVNLG